MVHRIQNQNLINNTNNSRPQSPYNNRDGNRHRRLFSRNRIRNVRNNINTLLDLEQMDNTTSHTETTDKQNVSEETLLEQQFNDLLLELNQETPDENFNCQEECNTFTTKNTFSQLLVKVISGY